MPEILRLPNLAHQESYRAPAQYFPRSLPLWQAAEHFLMGERVYPSRTAMVLQSARALACGGAA
jgi:hypothetical protein